MTVGMVYAGTNIYEKIWKEPEKIVGYTGRNTITEEELKVAISEEEARKKTEEILKRFGYIEEQIELLELRKDGDNIVWYTETDNKISISLDAKGGNTLWLFSDNIWNKDIDNYRTTKENAEKTARELCKKYGYDLREYNDVKISSNLEIEDKSYIWYVDFYKRYDNLLDKYNVISIAFVPEINELRYFIIQEENYENNVVTITEEEAKATALKEEQKTNIQYKIKNTEIELGIVSMNGEAYARTTNYKQFCEQNKLNYSEEKHVEYRTDRRIRKAWKVTIEYDIPVSDIFNDAFINGLTELFANGNYTSIYNESFNRQDLGYTYYVDVTTGEIIGGEEFSKHLEVIKENGKIIGINYKERES